MQKTKESISKKSALAKSKYDDLKGCCPPMSKSLLKDLIAPKPIGDIDDDYRLTFNSIPYYQNIFQAYLDYIVLIYPCVNKLVTHWKLSDSGAGVTPVAGNGTQLEQTWNWFVSPGSGNIIGNTNFFNTVLKENQWYHVHIGIYTESNSGQPCDAFDGKDCELDFGFHFRWQLP